MQNPENKNAAAQELVCAGFWIRLLAYALDFLIVAFVLWVMSYAVLDWGKLSAGSFLLRDLVFTYSLMDFLKMAAYAVYFILFTYFTGSTIGKLLFHLKVVTKEGKRPSLFCVCYRETIGRCVSSFLGLGYLMVAADSKKQGFHDMLSDTYVIQTDRKPAAKAAPEGRNARADRAAGRAAAQPVPPVYGPYQRPSYGYQPQVGACAPMNPYMGNIPPQPQRPVQPVPGSANPVYMPEGGAPMPHVRQQAPVREADGQKNKEAEDRQNEA